MAVCWGCWHLKRYCLEIFTTQSNQSSGMGPLRLSMPLRSEILRNCTESSSVASDFWKASTQTWFSYLSSQKWATSDKWNDNDEGASSKIGVFLQILFPIGVQPNLSEIALRHSADRGIKDRNGRPWSNRLYHTTVGQFCWNRRIVFIFKSGQKPFSLYWFNPKPEM